MANSDWKTPQPSGNVFGRFSMQPNIHRFPSSTENLKLKYTLSIKKESIFLGAGNLQKQTVIAKKDNIILGRKIT